MNVFTYLLFKGLNPNVEAYVDKTDEDIRKAIVDRGYATFPEQVRPSNQLFKVQSSDTTPKI